MKSASIPDFSVPDFANADGINFVMITKGAQDVAEYGKHYVGKPPNGKLPGHVAKELARGAVTLKPGNGQKPHKLPELSIKVEEGVNLYVIGFGEDTQTRFGPTSAPIQTLPPEYSNLFLKDVGLIYVDGAGNEKYVAAADIPANYPVIPESAMLVFTLDRAAMEYAWQVGVSIPGHTDYSIKIPFFLNLYDTKSGRPVWAYGEHDGPKSGSNSGAGQPIGAEFDMAQAKAANAGGEMPGTVIHGGIHPSKPSQFLY